MLLFLLYIKVHVSYQYRIKDGEAANNAYCVCNLTEWIMPVVEMVFQLPTLRFSSKMKWQMVSPQSTCTAHIACFTDMKKYICTTFDKKVFYNSSSNDQSPYIHPDCCKKPFSGIWPSVICDARHKWPLVKQKWRTFRNLYGKTFVVSVELTCAEQTPQLMGFAVLGSICAYLTTIEKVPNVIMCWFCVFSDSNNSQPSFDCLPVKKKDA